MHTNSLCLSCPYKAKLQELADLIRHEKTLEEGPFTDARFAEVTRHVEECQRLMEAIYAADGKPTDALRGKLLDSVGYRDKGTGGRAAINKGPRHVLKAACQMIHGEGYATVVNARGECVTEADCYTGAIFNIGELVAKSIANCDWATIQRYACRVVSERERVLPT